MLKWLGHMERMSEKRLKKRMSVGSGGEGKNDIQLEMKGWSEEYFE